MSITYTIRETTSPQSKEPDLSSLVAELHAFSIEEDLSDTILAMETEYLENYNKKAVSKIAEYYDISSKKSSKAEIVTIVVAFEIDPENESIVRKRHKVWDAFTTLRNDSKMKKYLLGDVI
tara:strand:- start:1403 stop:1765 length:363 start_codon:yes stop_codon:yes gene_type:complete